MGEGAGEGGSRGGKEQGREGTGEGCSSGRKEQGREEAGEGRSRAGMDKPKLKSELELELFSSKNNFRAGAGAF